MKFESWKQIEIREFYLRWNFRKEIVFGFFTRKNAAVDPPLSAPYLIFVCFARSSALSIGESILSTVKNAAKLAVYDEIMMSVKNHHIPATILVDTALRRNENSRQTNSAIVVDCGFLKSEKRTPCTILRIWNKACRLLLRERNIQRVYHASRMERSALLAKGRGVCMRRVCLLT